MSTSTLRSQRDLLVVAFVGVVGFVVFSIGDALTAVVGDAAAPRATTLAIRVILAFVIAAIMLVIERRRERPSINAATIDGIQIAAVVIIVTNLGGATESGSRLALRTALVLIGMPLLTVLTHIVAQRIAPNAPPDAV